MQLSKEQDRLLNWVYVFLPLIAGLSMLALVKWGLRDLVMSHLPVPIDGYFAQAFDHALNLAPTSWMFLTLGCSFGTVLNIARRANIQREKNSEWLSLLVLLVAAAHFVFGAAFVLLLGLFFRTQF